MDEASRWDDGGRSLSWEDLGAGAPTIIALARLCSNAIAMGPADRQPLSIEAMAILYTARDRGVIEIKGSNNAFDSIDRLLSVCVELSEDSVVLFKNKREPHFMIRVLDGFRQLCAHGLVMHHLVREVSLTAEGLKIAATISKEEIAEVLDQAAQLDRHQW